MTTINKRDEEEFEAFYESQGFQLKCLNGTDRTRKKRAQKAFMAGIEAERERSAGLIEEMKELRECVRVLATEFNRMHDIAKGSCVFYDDKTEALFVKHAEAIERCL